MKLKEIDWNAPGGATEIDFEYPDAPIVEFMNWLRRTTAWRENPEIVERRVRQLNMVLMDHRNALSAAPKKTMFENCTATDSRVGVPVQSAQERRLAGLAKAREVAAANRKAKAEQAATATA